MVVTWPSSSCFGWAWLCTLLPYLIQCDPKCAHAHTHTHRDKIHPVTFNATGPSLDAHGMGTSWAAWPARRLQGGAQNGRQVLPQSLAAIMLFAPLWAHPQLVSEPHTEIDQHPIRCFCPEVGPPTSSKCTFLEACVRHTVSWASLP